MRKFVTRFLPRFCGALALAAMLVPLAPQPADALIFRMLLGGGGAAPDKRDWSQVTSRELVSFRHRYAPGTVVVSFADRRLYLVLEGGKAYSYLIGTPVLEEKWSGESWVSDKKIDPRWIPTSDMRAKDPTLPLEMPGGHPRNPLGPRALYLGETLYRIHGTDAPWTVGHEVSNGCVRLYNRDIKDLYDRVPVGAKVVVTWEKFQRVADARGAWGQNAFPLR